MGKHLTPAEREERAHECYELSSKGLSAREIARRVGLSHPTVSALIAEEAQRRRKVADDHRVKSLAAKMKVVERLWEELDQKSPSGHAVAQLGMALRALLGDCDLITGVRAPTKTANVHHHVVENIRDAFYQTYLRSLADDEFIMFELLYYKTPGDHHTIPQDVDVVKVAFEYYQRNGSLEGLDAESLCVPRASDVPDFPPRELEGGW